MNREEEWMKVAVEKARQGVMSGQSPFGALVIFQSEVVCATHNTVWRDGDPTAHAEINAIREACRTLQKIDLVDAAIYSTCEPCPMCVAALHWAKVQKVVYGATIRDALDAGFNEMTISAQKMIVLGESRLQVEGGVLKPECMELFRFWKDNGIGRVY